MSADDHERVELRSLREHLDTRVVERMNLLEYALDSVVNYLGISAQAASGLSSRSDAKDAFEVMILALDRAGYSPGGQRRVIL